jgi:hypothetical protein
MITSLNTVLFFLVLCFSTVVVGFFFVAVGEAEGDWWGAEERVMRVEDIMNDDNNKTAIQNKR